MSDNTQTAKCPKCGATLTGDAPEGLCPRCLLALNLSPITEVGDEANGAAGTPSTRLPTPTPAEIAPHFPQLEIIECLGCGGMGAVYQARQKRIDRFVALKILSPERQGDAQFTERFQREARALARLNHPNIVTVHDFGETGGFCYLLMEYVEGVTLRQLMQQRKLSATEALAIVPKICDALQYAHGKGIVHRDIKPENILLATDGQVKIADFGIAKLVTPGAMDAALTGVREVVGTPHYMAPEQAEKPGTVDHRADIFSLGVVIYEMLTAELPLGKFAPPSRKAQVDVRLDEVVLRALEKEPELRYQRVSQVKTDLETITGSPAAAAPRGTRAHPSVPAKGSAPVLWLGLAIGILAIAGVYWLLLPRGATMTKPAGCVAWWRAEGNAHDAIGTNHGVNVGNVGYAPSRVGSAFDLKGSNYISVPNTPALNPTQTITVEGWVYSRQLIETWGADLISKDGEGSLRQYLLIIGGQTPGPWYSTGGFRAHIGTPVGFVGADGATFVEPNTWYHVAMTYDGRHLKLYVNGNLDAQAAASGPIVPISEPFRIGGGAPNGTPPYYFYGLIDELAVYNRALSAREIAAIYKSAGAMKTSTPLPHPEPAALPGLVAQWRAEGNALDSAGLNHGVTIGDVHFGQGEAGRAFILDGAGDGISVGNPPALQMQDFTIEAWIKRASAERASRDPIHPNSVIFGCSWGGYALGLYDDGRLLLTKVGHNSVTSTLALTDTGAFHHVAVTKSGNRVVFYVDGLPATAAPYDPGFVFDGPMAIGARGNDMCNSFLGAIDELAIYNRALEANEIGAIIKSAGATKTSPPLPHPEPPALPGLVAQWRAEGNALDSAGSNHGALMGRGRFGPAKAGTGFELGSPSDYVRITASPTLNVGAGPGFTVEGWILPRDVVGFHPIVDWNGGVQGGALGAHFWIGSLPNSLGELAANIVDTSGNYHGLKSANGVIAENVLQHVALTYDRASGLGHIFLNGEVVALANLGRFTPRTDLDLFIGRRLIENPVDWSYNAWFDGVIDELGLYNRALSAEEIARLYRTKKTEPPPAPPPSAPPPKPASKGRLARADPLP